MKDKNRKKLHPVPSGDDEGEYTEKFRASLRRSLSDLKNGRTHSFEEVKNIYKRKD